VDQFIAIDNQKRFGTSTSQPEPNLKEPVKIICILNEGKIEPFKENACEEEQVE